MPIRTTIVGAHAPQAIGADSELSLDRHSLVFRVFHREGVQKWTPLVDVNRTHETNITYLLVTVAL
jgi:hypothetical protein